jgi:protocatechuate 3,4-dioxygenase beta subunit
MMSSAIFLVLATAVPSAQSAEMSRPTATVEIRVTDRSGAPLKSAHVTTVKGSSQRVGETSASGRVTFHNMRVGTYLLRADHDAFIRLEKEFTVKPEKRFTLSPRCRRYLRQCHPLRRHRTQSARRQIRAFSSSLISQKSS